MPNDLDVTIVRNWNDFLTQCSILFEQSDELVVDLAFESSLDEHTHYHFDTDELVYPSEVFISVDGDVRFSVPYGSRTKSFTFDETELINGKNSDGKFVLKDKIEALFAESFKKQSTLIPDINALKTIISTELGFIPILNDTDAFLKQYELKIERKAKYSKLDFYGIF